MYLLPLAALIALASSHGIILTPAPRAIGPSSLSACGPQIQAIIKADNTSHVEGLPEAGSHDPGYHAASCNLWLCKGLQFGDVPAANIQAYAPGQRVNFKINLRIPHKGPANVSIVDTAANAVVGSPLYSWASYADESLKVLPKDNTDFDVVIPGDLGAKCATAGACVIQWWWYGTNAKQTYESCVDFTVADAPATPVTVPLRGRSWRS